MEKLLTQAETAKATRLTESALRYMRDQKTGPKWGKLGRRIVYREVDVIAWVNAQFEQGGQANAS